MQAQSSVGQNPRALLAFNAGKTGEVNIAYNTSFFIKDYNIDDDAKSKAVDEIMKKDKSIEVKLSDVDDKTGLYVIVNLFAKDKKELSDKMRLILSAIGVQKVEYNGSMYALKEFSF